MAMGLKEMWTKTGLSTDPLHFHNYISRIRETLLIIHVAPFIRGHLCSVNRNGRKTNYHGRTRDFSKERACGGRYTFPGATRQ